MLRLVRTASFRLAATYASITAIAFLVLYFFTYWIATEEFDRQIKFGVETEFSELVAVHAALSRPEFIQQISVLSKAPGGSSFYYYFTDGNSQKLSGNIDGLKAVDGWRIEKFNPNMPFNVGQTAPADDDHELVAYGRHLPDETFLLVGDDRYRALAAQEAIDQAFVWASILALALSVLAGVVVSRRFLRKIDRINATSNAIMRGQLKERIPVHGALDEIDRLAANLNLMLDSNQALLESLKQVSTGIAHDLRTPMSRLRQGLEEARLAAFSPETYKTAIDQAVAELDAILATFSALLRIAQIGSGSRRAEFGPVNLSSIAGKIVEAYRAVAEDESKVLHSRVDPDLTVTGDEDMLTQLLANLVENAIKHTPAGAAIAVEIKETASGVEAVVADDGPGIPEDERNRVFEHFYRLDRSRTTPGHGLGLSLVAAIAELHGIAVRLEDNKPGARAVVDFAAAR